MDVLPSVNSNLKLLKSATPKVSRGEEFLVGTSEYQSKIPQNACSLKRCPSFCTYKSSYRVLVSPCPPPCVLRGVGRLSFAGFAARS